jgi:hypothetical protein
MDSYAPDSNYFFVIPISKNSHERGWAGAYKNLTGPEASFSAV